MAANPASAALKRLQRFFFGEAERTDRIASLPRRQQEELADLAYTQGSKAASERLEQITTDRTRIRSAASKKAAFSKSEYRRAAAIDKILRTLGNAASAKTVRRNSYLWTPAVLKKIESQTGSSLREWIITQARKRMKPGQTNPMWYR